jgi:hypothetical protein
MNPMYQECERLNRREVPFSGLDDSQPTSPLYLRRQYTARGSNCIHFLWVWLDYTGI